MENVDDAIPNIDDTIPNLDDTIPNIDNTITNLGDTDTNTTVIKVQTSSDKNEPASASSCENIENPEIISDKIIDNTDEGELREVDRIQQHTELESVSPHYSNEVPVDDKAKTAEQNSKSSLQLYHSQVEIREFSYENALEILREDSMSSEDGIDVNTESSSQVSQTPEHSKTPVEDVITEDSTSSGYYTEIGITEGNEGPQTENLKDHQHAHHQVIEIEEYSNGESSSYTNHHQGIEECSNEDSLNATHDQDDCSECTCNCHTMERSNSGLVMKHVGSTEIKTNTLPYNQSLCSITEGSQSIVFSARTVSQTSQSDSSVQDIDQSGPSSSILTNMGAIREMGIQNPAYYIKRAESTMSRTSNNSLKPPAYKSLGQFYLRDEPPKYENITGKKLDDDLEETAEANNRTGRTGRRLSCKSRIAGTFILIGVILITALLVYLSITSENSQNTMGSGKN